MKQCVQTNPAVCLSSSNTWPMFLLIQTLSAGITEQINPSSPSPIICTNLEPTLGSQGILFAYAPVTLFMTCRDLVCVFTVDGVQLKLRKSDISSDSKKQPQARLISLNLCLTWHLTTEKYLSYLNCIKLKIWIKFMRCFECNVMPAPLFPHKGSQTHTHPWIHKKRWRRDEVSVVE